MGLFSIRHLSGASGALTLACACSPASAQTPVTHEFHLPEQRMDSALRTVARLSGRQIIYPATIVQGIKARAVSVRGTADQAIAMLLANTELIAEFRPEIVVIKRSTDLREGATGFQPRLDVNDGDILVTGTRIKGANTSSTTLTLRSDQIREAGQNSLGDAIRSLPQSFNGGQNPGVGIGAGGSPANENVGSGSTINLRGLGQDATLTLLNGHRVAYNVASQGVDASAIPLMAIDRIEIVADGASALYGSDAVGGVANIILKRDFEGFWTSARYGGSTDGGNRQQQYTAVGGHRWSTGGVIATYDFERDTPIVARQRSYASALFPDAPLLRFQKPHDGLISAHQEIAPDVTFAVDAVFNKRWTNYNLPVSSTADYRSIGIYGTSDTTTFSVAPSMRVALPSDWNATLAGVYSQDRTRYGSDFYVSGTIVSPTRGCYCNSFDSVELSGEGPVVTLPGGSARLALGGGYRANRLHAFRTVGSPQDIKARQRVYYGFAELNLPIFGPSQHIAGVDRLTFNAAIRYEDYADIDRLATPKLGAIYSPLPGLEIKASWGKSFKAPTLYQQFSERYASLYPVTVLGGAGTGPASTAILLEGANPDLKAERATTWSMTAVIEPPAITGLRAEIGYFDIDYRNRVATPIPSLAASMANPAYASLVDTSPTASQIGSVIDNPFIFFNYTDAPFSAGNVVSIVDNRYRNVSRQTVRGADALVSYSAVVTGVGSMTASVNATYLDSSQALSTGQPDVRLSGIIFNPPRFRGRAGLGWSDDGNSLTTFVNRIGSVTDDRGATRTHVASMTTLDLAGRLDLARVTNSLSGFELLLSIQNVFNDKPDIIRTSASYLTPYDSTNYSPVGRFVSASISKRW